MGTKPVIGAILASLSAGVITLALCRFLARLVIQNAPARSGEEVAQLVAPDPGKPDQDDGMVRVMFREVVRFGIVGEERRALLEIGAEGEGPGLRGAVDRHARDQSLA